MSGKHPDLPASNHPLGYTEAEAKAFLGYRWNEFKAWHREDLLSFDEHKQPRYWIGNVHGFLHQGELFPKPEFSKGV